jgi:hypothetical protein
MRRASISKSELKSARPPRDTPTAIGAVVERATFETVEVIHEDRVFHPEIQTSSARQIFMPVGRSTGSVARHDVNSVANGLADPLERLQGLAQICGRNVLPLRRLRRVIEWPDLHAGDAHVEEAVGQLIRLGQKGVEVLIGARARSEAKISRSLRWAASDIR